MVLILSLLFAFVVCAILGIKESESGIKINKNQDTSASQAVMEIPEIKKYRLRLLKRSQIFFLLIMLFQQRREIEHQTFSPEKYVLKKLIFLSKSKGTIYERFVGKLYENTGYKVIYNGIDKGSHDGGIDLICRIDKYTVLVQCKNYENNSLSIKDVYQFYGACRHYAIKNPREIVSGAFFISNRCNSETFIVINDLGISLYEGVKMEEMAQAMHGAVA